MPEHMEVVVIGGGQAGLAMGYYLSRQKRRFVILDSAPSIGHAWRSRYDSLTLFTPTPYHLPGLAMPGPDRYPTKDEVADYLELYVAAFGLPVRLNSPVRSVTRTDGGYLVLAEGARLLAGQVVVATGPFQHVAIPPLAAGLSADVFQVHSSGYTNPAQLRPGRVVVVGAGNSGTQIASELSRAHRVYLSEGKPKSALPQRFLGQDLFWWLTNLGVMDVTINSRIGRRMSQKDALIGPSLRQLSRSFGIELVGRAEQAEGGVLRFAGGREVETDNVIWATGFRSDYSWLNAPVFDDSGRPVHVRGVTASPGLYFLGLPWQHTRGSALLGWVGRDAQYLAERIRDYAGNVVAD